MKKPIAERISTIKAKQDALAARLATLKAQHKTDERKLDTRRKIIVGGAVLAHMEFDPAFAEAIRVVLRKVVTREQDIKTLGELLDVATPASAD